MDTFNDCAANDGGTPIAETGSAELQLGPYLAELELGAAGNNP